MLHLEEAVQQALQQQPSLAAAQASVGAAQGQSEQARASLLPQLSASALAQRYYGATGSRTGAATGVAGTVTANNFTFGLSGTQLIWDFQSVDRLRSSNANVASLQATEQATQLQVILNVRRAFFQAQAYRALVQVQDETLDNQIKHQVQTEGFVKAGTQPEIALAQARTNVANARVSLIQAQNNYRISKAQLNQAIGVVQGTDYEVAREELPPVGDENQPVESLMAVALKERPEIASLVQNRDAQELALHAAQGGYFPALSIFGSVAEAGSALDALGPAWNFGLQITWSFFDGLRTPGVVRQAQSNVAAASAQLTLEELQVRFDVEQADATLEGSKTSLTAAEDALVNAREQLRLAEARYQTGVGSIIELSDAQVAATNAGAQLVQARYNLATARAQLLAALGRR
ncbi:MAG TPA: TolC family protein [Myxococcaceae bacterium]|nr:TolC family protein [Myxococcaceae bacterium]